MIDKEIALALNSHSHEIGSLKHRIDTVEKKQDEITRLANSVNKLAINMEHMLEEQKSQGKRLKYLEQEPLHDMKHYKRSITTAILTTVIGVVLGALLALVVK